MSGKRTQQLTGIISKAAFYQMSLLAFSHKQKCEFPKGLVVWKVLFRFIPIIMLDLVCITQPGPR